VQSYQLRESDDASILYLFLQKHGTILKNWENEDIACFPLFVEWLYTIMGFNELISFHFVMLYFLYFPEVVDKISAEMNTPKNSNDR
jgi:hypothetical protein